MSENKIFNKCCIKLHSTFSAYICRDQSGKPINSYPILMCGECGNKFVSLKDVNVYTRTLDGVDLGNILEKITLELRKEENK